MNKNDKYGEKEEQGRGNMKGSQINTERNS